VLHLVSLWSQKTILSLPQLYRSCTDLGRRNSETNFVDGLAPTLNSPKRECQDDYSALGLWLFISFIGLGSELRRGPGRVLPFRTFQLLTKLLGSPGDAVGEFVRRSLRGQLQRILQPEKSQGSAVFQRLPSSLDLDRGSKQSRESTRRSSPVGQAPPAVPCPARTFRVDESGRITFNIEALAFAFHDEVDPARSHFPLGSDAIAHSDKPAKDFSFERLLRSPFLVFQGPPNRVFGSSACSKARKRTGPKTRNYNVIVCFVNGLGPIRWR
jgi:hypothetical protein